MFGYFPFKIIRKAIYLPIEQSLTIAQTNCKGLKVCFNIYYVGKKPSHRVISTLS